MPALSASWLHQGVLRCEDRPLLCLTWFVHAHAHTGVSSWSNLFCLQLLYAVWGSTKVIIWWGKSEHHQSHLCCADILTLFDAIYFDFFYKAIIRQYEIPKESRSCTVQRLYHNVQLRSQLYKQVYFKFTVITLWGWWVLWIVISCDYIFGQIWWPYSEVTPTL